MPYRDTSRELLEQALGSLRHAVVQPNLDRGIADGIIAPAIRVLEGVQRLLNAEHDERVKVVRAATVNHDAVTAQLADAHATIDRAIELLGATSPAGADCYMCRQALELLTESRERREPLP